MSELSKLQNFKALNSVSLSNTNLNDLGLQYVCMNPSIENLNLQSTKISDKGIFFLTKLPNLKYLRLKENPQLTNKCIKYFNKVRSLLELQIHETSIDQYGLAELNLQKLESIILNMWGNNYTIQALTKISSKLPNCRILVKGKAEFHRGKVLWSK